MSFSKKAFIIGAGAHVPYGMPTSLELTRIIKELGSLKPSQLRSYEPTYDDSSLLNEAKKICSLMRESADLNDLQAVASNSPRKIWQYLKTFIDTFAGSQMYSIDAFLSQKKATHDSNRTIEIGKFLIAYFISKSEASNPIGYHNFDWIQHFVNEYLRDKKSMEQFFHSPPMLISFNYDRILERSLMSHLIHYHSIPQDKAIEMIGQLRVTHIYGDIGKLGDEVAPSGEPSPQFIRQAKDRIQVIGEERNKCTEDLKQNIYERIKDKELIYILGFGFDPINCDILFEEFKKTFNPTLLDRQRKLGQRHTYPKFLSTNMGFNKHKINQVQRQLGPFYNHINFFENDLNQVDCMKLLTENLD
jgi:hypothetical protein